MEPQQASFDTFGRWQLTRLRANLAPSRDVPPSPLYRFFTDLYEDMLLNPGAYSIPDEPFVTFFALDPLSPEEKARHEALKAARMRVRKAVYGYLEFLFRLGQMGEPAGTDLQLPAQEVATLVADTAKKAKTRHILAALERSGLSFSSGDPLVVSNPHYPGMPAELATFSRACARVKESVSISSVAVIPVSSRGRPSRTLPMRSDLRRSRSGPRWPKRTSASCRCGSNGRFSWVAVI